MTEGEELAYERGERSALLKQLQHVLGELGYYKDLGDNPDVRLARLVKEREEVVATLRDHCGEHGDNDWPDNLHLVDVIDKHLMRHIDEWFERAREDALDRKWLE